MPEIHKILIPTDLSEHSKLGVRCGLELAESEQAEALVFHVADYRAAMPMRAELVAVTHSEAYTAQEVAESAHIPGKELAKSVIVKLDGRMTMVILLASCKVDFELLKKATGAREADLASENEFRDRFPDCELGAMPPFGNLYGMEAIVTESLTADDEIAFNAGSHTELMRLAYKDFAKLVNPKVMRVAMA